ncbi:PAS domain S-box protein [Alteromonas sediminis]|uniref:histidine kinase n=1 Tax=Alteromonas sediminis TaxID=2259342 RepID=A0A3N5Z7S8_9ALTE|nr:PAS domain-containing protein [Alteromonas sediminis]RPJ64908.1 PAS domain S-box protein [Alteromonas sediminis]
MKLNHSVSADLGLAIAEASSVLVWLSDKEKQCIYFNNAWLQYRGRTLEQEFGFGWAEGVHADDYDRCVQIYEQAFDARQPFSMEYRLQKANGEYGWIQDDGAPYYDNNGEFKGYIGSCYDITQTKSLLDELAQQKNKLESSNLRLTTSIKAGQVGIWDWDIVSDELFWDEQMFNIYGLQPSTKTNTVELWESALHPEDKASATRALQDALNDIKPYDIKFRIIRPTDDVRIVKASAIVMRDESGRPLRMLGTNLDVTAQHQADEKIRHLEKRNRALLDYSPVCHKIVDLDFNLRFMNANGFNMLSLPQDDSWFGKPYPFSFFPTDAKAQMQEKLEWVKQTKQRTSFESITCDSMGTEVWLFHTIIPVFKDDNKALDYLTVVSADITEQKEVQEQLQHREKMDAIGQLAGGVAHDFNNQLASILGYTELLANEIVSEKGQKYLSKIISSAERSSTLTKQLLTFSRKQKLIKEPVDIHEELHETVDLLLHAVDKRITVEQALDATNPIVQGDKSHLQSAFLNLAINAADAMNDGGILQISTQDVLAEDDEQLKEADDLTADEYVKVTFRDNGEGIDESTISKIFDPFFSTKLPGKGTGMGLASVYGAVKHHSGYIFVQSKVDKGTVFTLYFPAVRKQEQVNNKTVQKTSEIGTTVTNRTVLVVDDEPLIRELCHDVLTANGYQVLLATNGQEAVDMYAQQGKEIDVVILDLMMPVLNGDDAFKKLKALNPAINVIISSGYDSNASMGDLLNMGVAGVLEKPYKLDKMLTTLAEIVSQ